MKKVTTVKSTSRGTKAEDSVRLGKKKEVGGTPKYEICEQIQKFLDDSILLFGQAVINYMEDTLHKLPEEKQHEMVHMILHYCFTNQIESTGDSNVAMLACQIIKMLPMLSVRLMRMQYEDLNSKEAENSKVKAS